LDAPLLPPAFVVGASMAPALRRRSGGHANPEQQQGQSQVRAIYEALEEHDFAALEELAYSPLGFCSAELRRTVWLFLLGLSPEEANDTGWRRDLASVEHSEKDARVMHADVQRSVYSWDVHTGIRKSTRNQKRTQLSEVMHAILLRHKGKLAYFQGFHDIALVFLEVGTPAQAFHMVERLALFHLSDQLCWPFDQGLTPLLGALFFLLKLLNAPVADALAEANCTELHFAVPWVLTWFAHSLPRLHQQVMRLFDCLIASHPAMILYFSAALLLDHQDTILATPRELPDMVCALQQLPLGSVDVDEWAASAWRLARQVPPTELVARLSAARRRALPRTCPLLHYPHPWMPQLPRSRGAGVGTQAVVATANIPAQDMLLLAPVYRCKHVPSRATGTALLRGLLAGLGMGTSAGGPALLLRLFRALGMGGMLLATVAWLTSNKALAR